MTDHKDALEKAKEVARAHYTDPVRHVRLDMAVDAAITAYNSALTARNISADKAAFSLLSKAREAIKLAAHLDLQDNDQNGYGEYHELEEITKLRAEIEALASHNTSAEFTVSVRWDNCGQAYIGGIQIGTIAERNDGTWATTFRLNLLHDGGHVVFRDYFRKPAAMAAVEAAARAYMTGEKGAGHE